MSNTDLLPTGGSNQAPGETRQRIDKRTIKSMANSHADELRPRMPGEAALDEQSMESSGRRYCSQDLKEERSWLHKDSLEKHLKQGAACAKP